MYARALLPRTAPRVCAVARRSLCPVVFTPPHAQCTLVATHPSSQQPTSPRPLVRQYILPTLTPLHHACYRPRPLAASCSSSRHPWALTPPHTRRIPNGCRSADGESLCVPPRWCEAWGDGADACLWDGASAVRKSGCQGTVARRVIKRGGNLVGARYVWGAERGNAAPGGSDWHSSFRRCERIAF